MRSRHRLSSLLLGAQPGTQNTVIAKTMQSPFLQLPGELRNQILRALLIHRTPIITRSANQLAPPKPTNLQLCPNILLTSWRTYYEGLSILYGENTFQAHPSYLTSMLFAIDPSRTITASFCKELISRFHIRVRLDCDPYYEAEAVKKAFSGAELLEVELFRSSWGIGGYDALEGFMGVRGVRKAKVYGSVGAKFASWLEEIMQAPDGTVIRECDDDEYFGWVGESKILRTQNQ